MANVTSEHEARDAAHAAAAELELVQKDQGRLQYDLDCACDDLAAATRQFSDCWAAHKATSAKLFNAFRELTRDVRLTKQSVSKQGRHCTVHMKFRARPRRYKKAWRHKERTRCITNVHARAKGHVNDGIGSLGRAVQAAAQATHSLTCGVPDRESEVKYLREETELIDAF